MRILANQNMHLDAYSEESLSPKGVQKRKTDEVKDGVIVGMVKTFVQ